MRINVWNLCPKEAGNSIRKALEAINPVNSYFYFQENSADYDFGSPMIEPFEKMEVLKSEFGGEESFDIFVVREKFSDNYFSHDRESYSIITVDDWDALFSPPALHTYLAYQFVQSAAFFVAGFSWEAGNSVSHAESLGCCFDHCVRKDEIRFGMTAGMLCYACQGSLRQFGVDDEAIRALQQMLEQIRRYAIGQPRLIEPRKVFLIQRFSEHDENANAMVYGVEAAIRELGLEPFRADMDRRPGALLDKICRAIETSSVVVAKADEKNLNVYFELGYAAALDKPVYVVCESSLIPDMPSDVKGWELVTYKKGDYEGLKSNMKSYLSSIERFSET